MTMTEEARKSAGAYYTPEETVATLVSWAVRHADDRMLDPSCGDGRFLTKHRNSFGVEQDVSAARRARERVPWATIHDGDLFRWAAETEQRFDCCAGNPPFIRYQRFSGEVRRSALGLCSRLGAEFSSLTSSWAPFLVAAASLLRPGGRMAFVVPAEIGHAPYAAPLLEYLARSFSLVQLVAVREKIFDALSEDCWLLYTEGFGGRTDRLRLSPVRQLQGRDEVPRAGLDVTLSEWREWNRRLRPFLLSPDVRSLYRSMSGQPTTVRLGDVARVGIGYVTGANDFFHLRPSQANKLGIPEELTHPAVRNGKALVGDAVTLAVVRKWLLADEPVLLLRLNKGEELPDSVRRYLDSYAGREARESYKCRTREPWWVVPDVTTPDAFLSYMSGDGASLVQNVAKCVCTNSVHAVHLRGTMSSAELLRRWRDPLARLSCEIEGHPLGGGMLKVEPREAARILLARRKPSKVDDRIIAAGISELQRWRHYGKSAAERHEDGPGLAYATASAGDLRPLG